MPIDYYHIYLYYRPSLGAAHCKAKESFSEFHLTLSVISKLNCDSKVTVGLRVDEDHGESGYTELVGNVSFPPFSNLQVGVLLR